MARKSKFTEEQLREAVKNSHSFANVSRLLGLKMAGGNQRHVKERCRRLGIDTSHFTGKLWSRGRGDLCKPEKVLRILPQGSYRTQAVHLRRALLQSNILYQCKILRNMDAM